MTWALPPCHKPSLHHLHSWNLPRPTVPACLLSSHRPAEPPDSLTLTEGSPSGKKRPASPSKAPSEKGDTGSVLVRAGPSLVWLPLREGHLAFFVLLPLRGRCWGVGGGRVVPALTTTSQLGRSRNFLPLAIPLPSLWVRLWGQGTQVSEHMAGHRLRLCLCPRAG